MARIEHMATPNDKKLHCKFKNICKPDGPKLKMQKNAAKVLMEQAGLENHKGGCGIPELEKLQQSLPDYKIRVFGSMTPGSMIYSGLPAASIINLYNHNNHYDVITKLPAFFNNSYYCDTCHTSYSNRDQHQCSTICPCCHETPPCEDGQLIKCPTCNRYLRGEQCMANHLKHTERQIKGKTMTFSSICDRIQKCKDCGRHIRGIKNIKAHKCNHFMCRTCRQIVPMQDHKCFMQPLGPKKELVECEVDEAEEDEEEDEGEDAEEEEKEARAKPLKTYVFYDFETKQE